MSEWFKRFFDGLYAKVLPNTFDDSRTRAQARIVRTLLRLRRGHQVLDIPCGMGRLTLPLARMGMRMTGVDLTAAYLRQGRRAADAAGLDVRFLQSDMRAIEFDTEFDAAFNWFGSFGYFSDADNLAFAQRVFQALKPGGRFLIEGLNKSWVRTHWRPLHDQTINGVRIVQENRWHAVSNRVHSTWTFSKGQRTERHVIVMRLYNGTDLRGLLRAAGFGAIRLYGGYPPVTRLTRHSRRLLAVGTKPA